MSPGAFLAIIIAAIVIVIGMGIAGSGSVLGLIVGCVISLAGSILLGSAHLIK